MAVEREGAAGQKVKIPLGDIALEGELAVPDGAPGIVLFAHGSGSGRKSPRNLFVARALQGRRLGTLLFDLLTPEEVRQDDVDASLRFDVDLLAARLVSATDWLRHQPVGHGRALGYFGASTGAAAALVAASVRPSAIAAVVSRGGRPDLAGHQLGSVRAPTLLIVGEDDDAVVELNEEAFDRLSCPKELAIVPGATHLFGEPGALEAVAELAAAWFEVHLLGTARLVDTELFP
jgi:putative phosphoribosyl transferase